MNTPTITSAVHDAVLGKTVVRGTLDTRSPQRAAVELFIAHSPTSDFPEGRSFITTATTTAAGTWKAVLEEDMTGQTITTTATDQHGNTSEFSQQATIEAGTDPGDEELAIHDSDGSTGRAAISIAPNPTNGLVTVSNLDANAVIRLYDTRGIDVTPAVAECGTSRRLDVSALPTGLYLMVVTSPDGSRFSHKIEKR